LAESDHDVAALLAALRGEVESCTLCRLHETRTQAVFGDGDPNAGLMFVGEAPGYHEDKQGRPFVGAAGKLLEELLASIGLAREQVFIANVLKSRPPGNRDPQADEIEACQPYLMRQIALIRPAVICSLGNFATRLLSGSQSGITKVHGVPQLHEVEGHRFYLYPIYHPAAALYTPAMLETLRADFFRLPQLISASPPAIDTGADEDVGEAEARRVDTDGSLHESATMGAGGVQESSAGGDAGRTLDGPAGSGGGADVGGAGDRPAAAGAAERTPFRAATMGPPADEEQLGLF
jgi:uracil-DNA glycosylase